MQGPLLLLPPLQESNLLLAMFHIGLSLVRDSYFFFVKYHIGPTSECAQQWMPGPGGGIMESPPPPLPQYTIYYRPPNSVFLHSNLAGTFILA